MAPGPSFARARARGNNRGVRSPLAPHTARPAELVARLEAERRGAPFLVYRDDADEQVIHELGADADRLTVGRRPGCDLRLAWDPKVSRLHAELVRAGDEWTVSDDGLSHNGTHIGDERVRGQRRLRDGDVIAFGDTLVAFRDPRADELQATETVAGRAESPRLSDADRALLAVLCRPLLDAPFATPATNAEIAQELHLSVAAVKARLHGLFARFGLDELPQNQKRAGLAAAAIRFGLVTEADAAT
jgi:hypothetical protein